MDPIELIKQYANQKKVMQLATAIDNQPYVVNVHFYAADNLTLYWTSKEFRRHSEEIAQNSKAAATIMVHENTPEEDYVIGLTIIGTAEVMKSKIDDEIGSAFVAKLGHRPALLDEIASGQYPEKFYRLKPTSIVLFDNKNFPDNPRQELLPPL